MLNSSEHLRAFGYLVTLQLYTYGTDIMNIEATLLSNVSYLYFQLANRDYNNFTDLVRDLTRGCKNELEKVR